MIDADKYWPPHRDAIERAGINVLEKQLSHFGTMRRRS
jgi:hypothetical protein